MPGRFIDVEQTGLDPSSRGLTRPRLHLRGFSGPLPSGRSLGRRPSEVFRPPPLSSPSWGSWVPSPSTGPSQCVLQTRPPPLWRCSRLASCLPSSPNTFPGAAGIRELVLPLQRRAITRSEGIRKEDGRAVSQTQTRNIKMDACIAERGVDDCLNGPSVNVAAWLDGQRRARVGHLFLQVPGQSERSNHLESTNIAAEQVSPARAHIRTCQDEILESSHCTILT